jgi:enoyl-CoA hydratase/carnithine racemase
MTKKLLHDFAASEIARELKMAAEASAHIRTTDDFREGLASFLEKRAPHWTGK